jgi:hypothetical protein
MQVTQALFAEFSAGMPLKAAHMSSIVICYVRPEIIPFIHFG